MQFEEWQVFERTYQGHQKLMLAPHYQLADANSTARWRLPRKQSHGAKPSSKGSFGFWLLCHKNCWLVESRGIWGIPVGISIPERLDLDAGISVHVQMVQRWSKCILHTPQ